MSNRNFKFLATLFFVIGGYLGYKVSVLNKVDTLKLLNIVGIIYGLLGVVILSEFVVNNEKWRKYTVEVLSGIIVWAHMLIPFGSAVIVGVLSIFFPEIVPSSKNVIEGSLLFFAYTLWPAWVVEDTIFLAKYNVFKDHAVRVRVFGLFLIIAGMLAQLIAAVKDVLHG